ncbi:hypothetical protein COO60DRAFT_559991 [Scenedesmus sp. NREL 46B-D3]|nr:hypothetical protein COO60DRAFT_559991 [Scenedesmus sp. NREL 46B-D3]
MAVLLALLRQSQPTLLLQQQAARCLAGVVASQVAVSATQQRCLCTCSSSGSLVTAAPHAGREPQLLQLQQQQQQPWQQRHAASRRQLLDLPLAWPGQCSSRRTFLSVFTQPNSKAYNERRLIGYSPEQLYEVVSQVQHYYQFVPWCVGSNVLRRSPDNSYLEAELKIGFQMISERYTSRVKLQAPHLVTSSVADSALFHHLESTWRLQPGPHPHSTWLSFSVDFAFLNPLYANIAQLFFSEVVTRMMGAFEGRCKHLYGPPSFSPAGQRHLAQQQLQHQHQPQLQHQHSRHLQHVTAEASCKGSSSSSSSRRA